jgi:hypothetical protein
MVTISLAGIGMFFFVIGHSSLLYFLIDGSQENVVPIRAALLPRPIRGRVVSYLGLLCASLFWGILVVGRPADFDFYSSNHWFRLLCFVGFPLLLYLNYFLRRVSRQDGQIVFRMVQPTAKEHTYPILIIALLNILYSIFNRFLYG